MFRLGRTSHIQVKSVVSKLAFSMVRQVMGFLSLSCIASTTEENRKGFFTTSTLCITVFYLLDRKSAFKWFFLSALLSLENECPFIKNDLRYFSSHRFHIEKRCRSTLCFVNTTHVVLQLFFIVEYIKYTHNAIKGSVDYYV